jgi:hypothetical protein
MATIYPTTAGAYSTRTWNDDATGAAYGPGSPQPGDIVLANGLAITLDVDPDVASFKTTAGTNAVAGGSFTTSGQRAINADSYGWTTACLILTAGSGSVQNGNSYGGDSTGAFGTRINSTCVQNGNATGGSFSGIYGSEVNDGGELNGNAYGGTDILTSGAIVRRGGVHVGDSFGSDSVSVANGTLLSGGLQVGHAFGGSHGSGTTVSNLGGYFYGSCTGGTAAGRHGLSAGVNFVIAIIRTATGTTAGAFGVSASGRGIVDIETESGDYAKSLAATLFTDVDDVPSASGTPGDNTTRLIVPMTPMVSIDSATFTLDANTDEAANIFYAHKSGNVTDVRLSFSSVTSPPIYALTIEQCTGFTPNGTLVNAGASATFTPTSGTNTVALGTPATVAQGQFYAVRVKYSSGTVGASNRGFLRYGNNSVSSFNGARDACRAITSTNSGASWSSLTDGACSFAPIYSDESVEYGSYCIIGSQDLSFGTSNATDIGCRFIAPATCDIIGCDYSRGIGQTSGTRTLKLFDLSGTELASTQQTDYSASTTNNGSLLFATPYSVTKGSEYRLVFSADSSTTTNTNIFQYPDSACRDAAHPNCYLSYRSALAWNDWDDYAPMLVPLLGNFSSGIGGEGGGSAGFTGIRGISRRLGT